MRKTEDVPKMPVAAVENNGLSQKSSGQVLIPQFLNFRKSFKRFRQKKRPLQEDLSSNVDENVIDGRHDKVQNTEKDIENTMNILKRLSAYRASKKKKKKSAVTINGLNIVKWSSCESISDCKVGKHNSLRRSRASLLIPVNLDEHFQEMKSSTKKIPQYGSMNCIIDKPPPSSSEIRYSSQQLTNKALNTISVDEDLSLDITHTPINLSEEISEELSQIFGNTSSLAGMSTSIFDDGPRNLKRPSHRKAKSHSLSLPNINEHNIEETCIDIDIDNVDIIVEEENRSTPYHSTPYQCNFEGNVLTDKRKKCKSYSTNCSTEKLPFGPTVSAPDKFSMYFSSDSIFSSPTSIDRPPVPCCPKPTNRLDSILKSASTEALSARKPKISDENCLNAKKRTNSSPDCTALIKKREASKNVILKLEVDDREDSRVDNMNCKITKPHLRGCISTIDIPNLFLNERLWKKALSCQQLPYSIAEAVWDHTSLDAEELNFSSGDVLHVLFMEDDNWWWGANGDKEGWFPASYVRQCVIQEIGSDLNCEGDYVNNNNNPSDVTIQSPLNSRLPDLEKLKAVRSKCVEELLTTEMDYVQLLKNIIEGYLVAVRSEEELFDETDAEVIFSNIEELYEFHQRFVKELKDMINLDHMERSSVGKVFLKNESNFEIYSKYCNNQPKSSARLSSLTKDKKYKCFFERCRLKQNMIRLSLDGFLLSPVQRICKYPLQLKELLKHTSSQHEDYEALGNARTCMQNVASLINERKRRLENVHNLAYWQYSVLNWKDENIALRSNELIHTGTLNKIVSNRIVERLVYVFDHQLVYFRKYSAKRHHLSYCGRIDLDCANIVNMEDDVLTVDNVTISNAWKVWDGVKSKWHLFIANSNRQKEEWLSVFKKERKLVQEEIKKGLHVLCEVREAAIENAYAKHLTDLKRRRLGRKSVSTYLAADFDGFPTSPLTSKFSDTNALFSAENVPKRRQRNRRKNSLRWSLGSMLEKYL